MGIKIDTTTKPKKRSGLLGAIGGALGGVVGLVTGGPAGAVAGFKTGSSVGGLGDKVRNKEKVGAADVLQTGANVTENAMGRKLEANTQTPSSPVDQFSAMKEGLLSVQNLQGPLKEQAGQALMSGYQGLIQKTLRDRDEGLA